MYHRLCTSPSQADQTWVGGPVRLFPRDPEPLLQSLIFSLWSVWGCCTLSHSCPYSLVFPLCYLLLCVSCLSCLCVWAELQGSPWMTLTPPAILQLHTCRPSLSSSSSIYTPAQPSSLRQFVQFTQSPVLQVPPPPLTSLQPASSSPLHSTCKDSGNWSKFLPCSPPAWLVTSTFIPSEFVMNHFKSQTLLELPWVPLFCGTQQVQGLSMDSRWWKLQ